MTYGRGTHFSWRAIVENLADHAKFNFSTFLPLPPLPLISCLLHGGPHVSLTNESNSVMPSQRLLLLQGLFEEGERDQRFKKMSHSWFHLIINE